jgi:tetratricopeptide (TPR) repeat protein
MKSQFSLAPRPTLILVEEDTVHLPWPALATSASAPEADDPHLASKAAQRLKQGKAHFRQGQYASALGLLQQALQTYRHLADQFGEAQVLLAFAGGYYRLADYLWAADYSRQCLKLAHKLKDSALMQQALEYLGNSYRHLGDLEHALKYMGKSLQLAMQMGDRPAEMRALNNLAMVYRAKGLTREAAKLYETSLQMAKDLQDTTVRLQILQNLGNTYQTLQHYTQAITCYENFLSLYQSHPSAVIDNRTTRRILTQLTTASLAIQDYNRAIIHLQHHLTIACTLGDTRAAAALIDELSRCYTALNQVRSFRIGQPG